MIVFRVGWKLGTLAILAGLSGTGCDTPGQVTDQIIETKRQTEARLDEMKLHTEMDFAMQPVFFLLRDAYLAQWESGPVANWNAVMASASNLGKDAVLLRDAKNMGIEPIWNIERPTDPEILKSTMIAHAPHLFQGLHWGLMGDGHFEKMTQAQLDARMNPSAIAK